MRFALALVMFAACGKVNSNAIDAPPLCTASTCDDGDACTLDTCDPLVGCAHVPMMSTGSQMFAATGAIQQFVVPCTTSLHIVAAGAQGGASNGQPGGLGASMDGTFAVTQGHTLQILVGGSGIDGSTTTASQRGGTGGGGTFVVDGTTILVIAGGGGGAIGGLGFGTAPGGPGQTGPDGQTGMPMGGFAGGMNGGGGTSSDNNAYHGGTGGGGYLGDGVGDSMGNVASYGTANTAGKAFVNGGAGGTGGTQGRDGGFGGGGAAGYCGGGGGGYSGGGAGTNVATNMTAPYDGGGGGSINNGTSQTNQAGVHSGAGSVAITW